MILKPFTAQIKVETMVDLAPPQHKKGSIKNKKNVDEKGLDDPVLERDIAILLKRYLKTEFIFDAIANLPVFIYDIMNGFPDINPQTHITYEFTDSTDYYAAFMLLKIFRLVELG